MFSERWKNMLETNLPNCVTILEKLGLVPANLRTLLFARIKRLDNVYRLLCTYMYVLRHFFICFVCVVSRTSVASSSAHFYCMTCVIGECFRLRGNYVHMQAITAFQNRKASQISSEIGIFDWILIVD